MEMTIEIKVGELADFFESAKETARTIDAGNTPVRKNRIWVDAADVVELLKPSRVQSGLVMSRAPSDFSEN